MPNNTWAPSDQASQSSGELRSVKLTKESTTVTVNHSCHRAEALPRLSSCLYTGYLNYLSKSKTEVERKITVCSLYFKLGVPKKMSSHFPHNAGRLLNALSPTGK